MRNKLLSAVVESLAAGICVVPPRLDGSKAPIGSWKQYQSRISTAEDHAKWYASERNTGIGWVCGSISGNLEVIDFDNRETYERFKEVAKESGAEEIVQKIEAGYLEHTPHGAHWPYRCEHIEGNKVLAYKPSHDGDKAIIETRGQGGYIVVAPSHGSVNPAGEYKLISGGPSTIATLTIDERNTLHDLARSLCEKPKAPPRGQRPRAPGIPSGNRPGEIYARDTSWSEVLEPHGWSMVRQRGDTLDWRRPGKRWGISATTNHEGADCLYVFSSNASPFEAGRSYTKFGAFAELNHGGDYDAAARELGDKYGAEIETGVNLDALIALSSGKKKPEVIHRQRQFPKNLLQVPGLLGEFRDWILSTSHKPQPVLSLAASIAAVAGLIGRKVKMESGLRPNIYIVAMADPGDGKERLRAAIRSAFISVGAQRKVMVDNIASDAALVKYVEKNPCGVLLLDEIGKLIEFATSKKSQPYQAAIIRELVSLYGVSDSVYFGKLYKNSLDECDDPIVVHQPCISLFGTAPGDTFYKGLKREQINDGFISRLLIFDGEPLVPPTHYPSDFAVPKTIRDIFAQWESWQKSDGDLKDIIEPKPATIKCSDRATEALRSFDAFVVEHQNKLRRNKGRGSDGIFARCATTAQKLSLIRACGRFHTADHGGKGQIEESDARWGIDLAWHLIEAFHLHSSENMVESQHQSNLNLVRRVIRATGARGIAHSGKDSLMSQCRSLKSKEISEIIVQLVESGDIAVEATDSSTRKGRMYYYLFE